MKSSRTGLTHIAYAFLYSMKGIAAAFRNESAFRIEIVFFIVLFPTGLYIGKTAVEKAVLVAVLFIVLIAEIVNSAIEAVVDRVGSDYHVLSGQAKDMASAAVLLSLLLAGTVWALILFL